MNTIITVLLSILTALSGGQGIMFYFVNRRLKKAELADKETDVLRKQDDEWQELYHEIRNENNEIKQKIEKLRKEKEELSKANGLLEMKNQQLSWFRCQVNNCPNRRPPHVFDKDGVELEAAD